MRAKVFVGYTEDGATLGEAMANLLRASVDAVTWKDAFSVGDSIFSELLHQPYLYDFGVFVFSPKDFRFSEDRIRRGFLASNLAFELGLFIGVKGKNRAFPVWPTGYDLPSDLQGVIHPRFNPDIEDLSAALQPACEQIFSRTQKLHFDDCYFIMNKRTGRCIDVEDWARRPGKRIIQWRYHGGLNQLWSMERCEDPWFKITSVHSGRCLQVKDARTDDDAPIEQGIFEEKRHQQWSLTRGPERAYIIENRHSGKVLAAKAGGAGKRSVVVQRTWHHGDDKLWWISREARI